MRPVIAMLLALLLLLPGQLAAEDAPSYLDDIALDHWAYPILQYAQKSGWLPGYPEDYFERDEPLIQYEFVLAMVRLSDTVDLQKLSLQEVQLVNALWIEYGADAEGFRERLYKDVLADEISTRMANWE